MELWLQNNRLFLLKDGAGNIEVLSKCHHQFSLHTRGDDMNKLLCSTRSPHYLAQ